MARFDISLWTDTCALGAILAKLLATEPLPCLLRGDLGSGKTALIGQIVSNLPDGHLAEPASPSFTICNYYPTRPEVLHCDLYRLTDSMPEDLLEFLQDGRGILLVEWPERWKQPPANYLDIFLNVVNDRRTATTVGHGCLGTALETRLAAAACLRSV